METLPAICSSQTKHRYLQTEELRNKKLSREHFKSIKRRPITVILDGVGNHYNIGAIFRACDNFLVEKLIICKTDFNPKNRKFKKAARGVVNWVPHITSNNPVHHIKELKSQGYKIISVEQTTCSVKMSSLSINTPICIVLGSESYGVSQDVLDESDYVVEIPIEGMANSINVSMVAAIVLHGCIQHYV
jgi:23S rRNA (guanosine2251-2'-O)-methyltransferase